MTNKVRISKEELRANLATHIGSERWFRHWTHEFTYTEGVQYLAEAAGAYWLIDLIASYCTHQKIKGEEFVVWKLAVKSDRAATATASDGDENQLLSHGIAFTDFPLDEITLYLTDHTLLLPSEY